MVFLIEIKLYHFLFSPLSSLSQLLFLETLLCTLSQEDALFLLLLLLHSYVRIHKRVCTITYSQTTNLWDIIFFLRMYMVFKFIDTQPRGWTVDNSVVQASGWRWTPGTHGEGREWPCTANYLSTARQQRQEDWCDVPASNLAPNSLKDTGSNE